MAKNEKTILRNTKVKEEYNDLRTDGILTRDEAEGILAKKYKRTANTIRQIVSKKNYSKKTNKV
ncbi:hypothetical protein DNC80_14255 [Flavobacterium sp. SOK18b]|uniref:hypothetical protein n=1 Tax=Flavobacterium sp. SOK18b TaxID=797900 RepID=UPI0015F8B89A|nr:hypothetical protein [Flavobacterium sp. SOK18b]MBB1194829.1 hypothetical protein [Flavobacterium sp. SOK18b]